MELSVNAATSSSFSSVSFGVQHQASQQVLLLHQPSSLSCSLAHGMVRIFHVSTYGPRITMTQQTAAVLSDLTVSCQWSLPSLTQGSMVIFTTIPPSWAV